MMWEILSLKMKLNYSRGGRFDCRNFTNFFLGLVTLLFVSYFIVGFDILEETILGLELKSMLTDSGIIVKKILLTSE